jgi:hypothetical protein
MGNVFKAGKICNTHGSNAPHETIEKKKKYRKKEIRSQFWVKNLTLMSLPQLPNWHKS